ncbi:MAG: PQQ-dependent sugar dehydrogenase [bacterium]
MKTLVFTVLLLGISSAACSQSPPSNFRTEQVWKTTKLAQPVAFAKHPSQPRWWVTEQAGRVVTFEEGKPATVALDLKDRVRFGGERGLLGVALDPKFDANGRIFVNYTASPESGLETRVSSFTSKDGGKTFDPASEVIRLRVAQPYSNHNGGHIAFGPDGYLYIGLGDGGSGGDPKGHGQNKDTLLGSMARIDVSAASGYTIPKDNPFAKGGGRPEIYAWGLRNPWKFSFAPDGKLWVADVGQNAWEEVDIVEKGKNYGWNVLEGTHCYAPKLDCSTKGMTAPVTEYGHDEGQSITGGFVYRGALHPNLVGQYIFGDFVSGKIWAFDPKTAKREFLIDTSFAIPTFVEASDGEVLVVDYGSGGVHRLVSKESSK